MFQVANKQKVADKLATKWIEYLFTPRPSNINKILLKTLFKQKQKYYWKYVSQYYSYESQCFDRQQKKVS